MDTEATRPPKRTAKTRTTPSRRLLAIVLGVVVLVQAVLVVPLASSHEPTSDGSKATADAGRGRALEDDEPSPDAVADLVDDLSKELTDYWSDVFADEGLDYVEPEYAVVTEDGKTPPACGGEEVKPGDGSAFCNGVVYFDMELELGDLEDGGIGSVYFTLGHETGHDVQYQLGLMGDTPSIELELEADCMAGAYLATVVADGDLSEDQFAELLDLVYTFGDPSWLDADEPGAHGRGSQRVMMVLRGYFNGTDACGTF